MLRDSRASKLARLAARPRNWTEIYGAAKIARLNCISVSLEICGFRFRDFVTFRCRITVAILWKCDIYFPALHARHTGTCKVESSTKNRRLKYNLLTARRAPSVVRDDRVSGRYRRG